MSEEHHGRQGFFSRIFSPEPEEEEQRTTIYSAEDLEAGEEDYEEEEREGTRRFTVERAAEIIRNLPPEVPRSSAVRIVRQTLIAAGIDIEELASSTRARESKLNSEISLRQKRIQDLKERTEEVIRQLEDEIRKAREARNTGIAEEERRIARAREGLEDVERVRDFFGLPRGDAGYTPPPEQGEETQVMDRPREEGGDEDDTRVIRRPGPLSEGWEDREQR